MVVSPKTSKPPLAGWLVQLAAAYLGARILKLSHLARPQFLNLLTFGLWGKLGKLLHYSVDAVLSTS